jgi:MFS transporter, DHA2 family, multidrug resistance protein
VKVVQLLAYIDLFWTLAVIGALMIPLALSMRSIDLNAPAKGH